RLVLQLQGGGYSPLDWSPDDRTILVWQGVSVNESYLWLVDVARGEKTLLAPQPGSESVAYRDAKFSRDGKGIYLSTDQGSEFQRLAYLDLATKGYRFLTTAIPWDVDEFDLSPDDRWIACVTNEDGVGTLHVLNAATGTERRIPRLPAGLISDVRWRKRGAELGFTRTSARAPADAYSLELTSGTVTRCTSRSTATQYAGSICLSGDVVVISSLVSFLQHTTCYRDALRRVRCVNARGSTLSAWLARPATLQNIDRVPQPFFLIPGMNDPRV